MEPVSVANSETHSESETSNADSKESKPRRSRFSVEPESRESSVGVSRSESVQPELGYSGGRGESRADSPEVEEQAVAVENNEVVMIEEEEPEVKEKQLDEIVSLNDTEESLLLHTAIQSKPGSPSSSTLPVTCPGTSSSVGIVFSSPLRPVVTDDTVELKRLKLASLQERLAKLKTTTSACELEDPALKSENQEPKEDIGDQSVVCSVENCTTPGSITWRTTGGISA